MAQILIDADGNMYAHHLAPWEVADVTRDGLVHHAEIVNLNDPENARRETVTRLTRRGARRAADRIARQRNHAGLSRLMRRRMRGDWSMP